MQSQIVYGRVEGRRLYHALDVTAPGGRSLCGYLPDGWLLSIDTERPAHPDLCLRCDQKLKEQEARP